jgi:glycosyltransferase involved in cell wall biosynthesis
MRVLINAASAHMGGAVTYLQNVLQWLPEVAPQDEYIVYVPQATREKLSSQEGVALHSYPYSSTQGAQRLYFDQVALPSLAREKNIDVLFSSTGFGSLWSPCPQVLLIRNMAYFDPTFRAKYQELGRSLTKNTMRRWHSLLSIRCADFVLFPTRAMQTMVGQYVSLSESSTQVIHYGFDDEHFQRDRSQPSTYSIEARYGVEDGHPILLNVSTYAVHKNFETLIEALPALLATYPELKLLTTTSREDTSDKAEYDQLRQRAAELGVADAWIELGYVPYRDLPGLYQAADLYVFPSFAESFGHSLVEAMAAGLPVVAADMAVNREVCEEAGRYFAPFEPADCAQSIITLLSDDEQRQDMKDTSLNRAQHFSWKRYASELVHIFQSLAR